MRTYALSFLICAVAAAQPPVAPTNEPTGDSKGQNIGSYNILQSFELGYRWHATGGDDGMYRSTVNYGNGIRLLSSSLAVQSREGHGGLFDQISLNTLGLGNDPYQSATLRIEKNRLYRYDLLWRSNAYYNPGLTIAQGEHLMDTVRHLQDHDFTLFPQGNARLFLGYSRDTQSGPALSTIQLFDASRGDEFPLFANIHREQDEYRLGGEVVFFGFRLNVLHSWVDFKEDSPTSLTQPSLGNNPGDLTTLSSFKRSEPYHGTSPYWRGFLIREGKRWAANARMTYVAGKRGFVMNEASGGLNRFGLDIQRQVITFGDAQRPAMAGNFTLSLFPTTALTLTNQTSIDHIRMVGNSFYQVVNNGSASNPALQFQFLGIQTIENSTDAILRVRSWFSLHGGYAYSNRRIRSIEGVDLSGQPASPRVLNEQTNQLHSGTLGFRLKPIKPLTINVDGEIGRADRPIYPISDKDYQALRGRIEYRQSAFRLAAYARTDYNTNSISLTSYASHSRQYGADASWTPRDWFSLDAGYSKLHLNTLGGLAYFAGNQEVTTNSSYYVSNIRTGTLAAHFSFHDKVDVSLGFNHVQDVGDGRSFGPVTAVISPQPPPPTQIAASYFYAAQTFPLRFTSPMAKVSVRLRRELRWNAGYQYYGYRQDFSTQQNYRANTGYSSLSWSF